MGLEVKKEFDKNKNVWILKPMGEIDIYTSPSFRDILLEMINEKSVDVILDGEGLIYMDSTGLGVLISGLKKLREKDKNIILTNIKPNINKLFDITGLNKVFIIKE
ncbi:anti-sigma B factor antagonist [Caloranaerobacter azorensis DSM 13643]|uniref:Anti-sigma factor antagonist n=1 Tax=Caloranaerobacter azorensis DSM 13643 TaxID=1121264 RepID=A0A1M5VS43_9FIRM|nr:STAS domain-containing protein [Caloranaerobacter azorensis]SHH78091.1 anti-sigma B factor antagonist [Caloranaerobacter azorensis DSM 13643]